MHEQHLARRVGRLVHDRFGAGAALVAARRYMGVLAFVVGAVVLVGGPAGPAGAHAKAESVGAASTRTAGSTRVLAANTGGVDTTRVPGVPTSSPPVTGAPRPAPDDRASSPVGQIVFFAVTAVIIVGAVVLYLRNRGAAPSGRSEP